MGTEVDWWERVGKIEAGSKGRVVLITAGNQEARRKAGDEKKAK
jgi:hypothetical protein